MTEMHTLVFLQDSFKCETTSILFYRFFPQKTKQNKKNDNVTFE